MLPSKTLPRKLDDKTYDGLMRKLLLEQVKVGGKVKIIQISQDLKTKDWYLIYYPPVNYGDGL